MTRGLVAEARITIGAPTAKVWDALINPQMVSQYMFGTAVASEWKKGSPIVWKGVWKGKSYEDKGTILELKQERVLQYSHFSPLTGLPDVPENYHEVAIELSRGKEGVVVSLKQDNNPTEEARDYSKKNWEMMLARLKELLESGNRNE